CNPACQRQQSDSTEIHMEGRASARPGHAQACPSEGNEARETRTISRIQSSSPQPSPKPTPLPSLAFHVHLSHAGEIIRAGRFSRGEKVRMRELFLTSVRAGLAFTERPIHFA